MATTVGELVHTEILASCMRPYIVEHADGLLTVRGFHAAYLYVLPSVRFHYPSTEPTPKRSLPPNRKTIMSDSANFVRMLPTDLRLAVLEARLRAAKVPLATAIKPSGENFVGTDVAAEQTKYDNLVAEKDELVDAVLEEAENFLGLNFGSIIGTIGKVTGTIAGAAGKAISIVEKIGPIVQKVTQAKDVLQGISGALASSSNFTEDKAQAEQIAATVQKADDLDAALTRVQGSLKALTVPESFTEGEPDAENFLSIVFGAIQAVSTVVGIVKSLRK
ncbi:hypothetical protein NLJ89_g6074 [Agrocybe chaxingu]|uniref:Uncharacterized protein n=1 Tax=Agrocybe chaxingu TaxID=84603 RepID=A0A9W8JZU4_9AGAR|nr:hypothetical protein NLJ89_g6074 [Agrocybe chaxingu]